MFEKEAEKHKEHFVSVALNLGMSLNTADTIGTQKEESFQHYASCCYDCNCCVCYGRLCFTVFCWRRGQYDTYDMLVCFLGHRDFRSCRYQN